MTYIMGIVQGKQMQYLIVFLLQAAYGVLPWKTDFDIQSQSLGPAKEFAVPSVDLVDLVKTANEVTDFIVKVHNIALDGLEAEIKQVRLDIEGISKEQRGNFELTRNQLYQAKNHIHKNRAILKALAEETQSRVDDMIYYLNLVGDDWKADKIEKFIKIQAGKMTELVDRCICQLKDIGDQYLVIQDKLAVVKANLESFSGFVQRLGDTKSKAYEKAVTTYRTAIYVPCAASIGGGVAGLVIGYAVCATALETQIAKWSSAITELTTILVNNREISTKILDNVDKEIKFLDTEVSTLESWKGKLQDIKTIDWKFTIVELVAFKEVKPRMLKSLNKLKKAAQKYLDNEKNKARNQLAMLYSEIDLIHGYLEPGNVHAESSDSCGIQKKHEMQNANQIIGHYVK